LRARGSRDPGGVDSSVGLGCQMQDNNGCGFAAASKMLEEAKLHGAVCDFGKRWHHDERAAWLHEFVSVQLHVRVRARPLPVRTRARVHANVATHMQRRPQTHSGTRLAWDMSSVAGSHGLSCLPRAPRSIASGGRGCHCHGTSALAMAPSEAMLIPAVAAADPKDRIPAQHRHRHPW